MVGTEDKQYLVRVRAAIDAVTAGKMVIMVDDEDRENEGDLVFAAEHSTPELINFMAKEARGLICLTMDPAQIEKLKLPQMGAADLSEPEKSTAFTVSIEAAEGVTTGISAADRSHTCRVAVAADCKPTDLVVPGHIFPLRAQPGGVLERMGHTEGSVDLAILAGCRPSGVICEIMNDDGTMARMPDLEVFSEKHNIPIVAIADLIAYRLQNDNIVKQIDQRKIKTPKGEFNATLYKSELDGSEHIAITNRHSFDHETVHVRVHSQRSIIDVFGPTDAGKNKINYGLDLLAGDQPAALVYLCKKNADRNLLSQLEELSSSAATANKKYSNASMDNRTIGTGAQILRNLGVEKMNVHMSSPKNISGLTGFGLKVEDITVLSETNA